MAVAQSTGNAKAQGTRGIVPAQEVRHSPMNLNTPSGAHTAAPTFYSVAFVGVDAVFRMACCRGMECRGMRL